MGLCSIPRSYSLATDRTDVYTASSITQHLLDGYHHNDEDAPETLKSAKDGMSLEEKINLWRQKLGADSTTQREIFDFKLDEDEDELGIYQYLHHITESSLFEWLLSSLNQQLHMVNFGEASAKIRRYILTSLPQSRKISRRSVPESIDAVFHVDLNLDAYMEQKGHIGCPSDVLPQIICLTGSTTDAQATTVVQYMRQTWPETGKIVLEMIQDALQRSIGASGDLQVTRKSRFATL